METAAITVRWKIDAIKKKMEESSVVKSPYFDGRQWYISIRFGVARNGDSDSEQKFCSINLCALPNEAESEAGTGRWKRSIHFTCKMETLEGKLIKGTTKDRPKPVLYHEDASSWGWRNFETHEVILRETSNSAGIVVEFSVYRETSLRNPDVYPTKALSRSLSRSLDALFEDSTTDVVFKIRQDAVAESERYLFAHKRVLEAQSTYFAKLFGSGFSESTRVISYAELRDQKQEKQDDDDDNDDDPTEWLPSHDISNDVESDIGRAVEPSDAGVGGSSEAAPARSSDRTRTDDSGVATTVETPSIDNKAVGGDAQMSPSEPAVEKRLQERNLREVIVVDAGWTTFRALIYWIYTQRLFVTELSSNYLVYLSSLASELQSSANQDDCTTPAPTSPVTIPSRRAWLLSQAEKDGRFSPVPGTIEPATPHALYRLADKLDISDVKEGAKSVIINGFTVENILYELISTFSYHYSEMQDAALAFALENWEQVKLTPAFKKVVSGSCMGRIEGASEIWMKLLGKLTVGSSTVPQKRAARSS